MTNYRENSGSDNGSRLSEFVKRFSDRRVLIVGDLIADQFLYGEIERVSREAPVLILRYEKTVTEPGGAANCALNVASLGARSIVVGTVGGDAAGQAMLRQLRNAGVDCDSVLEIPDLETTQKVRVLAGQVHSTRQQVLRIDYDHRLSDGVETTQAIIAALSKRIRKADAVILSDYNYGVINNEVAESVRSIANDLNIPVVVDSRFSLRGLGGFSAATPNEDEIEAVFGSQPVSDNELARLSTELCSDLGFEALLVTRGSNGSMLVQPDKPPLFLPVIGAREPVDVTGAGDTVIAAFSLTLSSGGAFSDAARIANHAGGLVVMKRGTATTNQAELLTSLVGLS